MDASFWHERWQNDQIAFHEGARNALLARHWPGLCMGHRVFVPLCGKAEDLAWLAAQGHDVVGAELDARAVAAFFAEHDLAPEISRQGGLTLYAAGSVSIWQGDIFALNAEALGPVDATFDRAALVALPPEMRARYAPHLTALTSRAPQLLITYEYTNPEMQGPPHSVPEKEVRERYEAAYSVTTLERTDITGPLLSRTTGSEAAYHLAPR
ncbi:MAG: thiopurine S-methyltransferase [Pseudomonadota bacterium]